MLKTKKQIVKAMSLFLVVVMMFSIVPIEANAKNIIDELFGISFYNFHYLDENGREQEKTFYNWGSESEEENGIKIEKTGLDSIKLVIDANNEFYKTYKPELIWVHMGDGLMDITRYTDIETWYKNKLNNSYLLFKIPEGSGSFEVSMNVPMKMNTYQVGLLDGGYYETEFYSAGTIPEQLMFAYEAQSYTLEELEEYINFDMEENIAEYYNADSGFRSNTNGFTFMNSDYEGGGGTCAGYAGLSTAIYNGYNVPTTYKGSDDKKITVSPDYTWYDNIYGNESIRNITLNDKDFINNNSPSKNLNGDGTANYYDRELFTTIDENDHSFFELLRYYLGENNKAVFFKGNVTLGPIKWQNLENRWSIIDYVASYLRQGQAVTVNLSQKGQGGHAIVGYKMEQIDEDTFRLYCYDNNFPDNMRPKYTSNNLTSEQKAAKNEDGSYTNIKWYPENVYIDITKKTIVGKYGNFGQKEYEVFEFDSSHTSFPADSKNGTIAFSIAKDDKVGVFNYGNDANEIISYKAYPVIKDDKTVEIRTFAFYKSGEAKEITNSINTTIKMDYNYIGWYKIKDSKITLTKKDYKFNNSGNEFVECLVTYDNHTDSYGQITVRIPVSN